MKRLIILVLAASLLTGCITQGQVNKETHLLLQDLQKREVHAYICAPYALAMARAHAEFAKWESDQGDSYKARNHLLAAKAWYNKVIAEAFEPDRTTFKPGCEGDRDGDGILDSKDKCPDEAEDCDADQDDDGCPEYDRDGDGIPDEMDKCPEEPEDKDGFEDANGCPDTDNDLDGIPDVKDKCPNVPEDFDKFEDEDGCPEPDNDGDGIPDIKDKCPNKPEDFDGDQDEDGCPDLYKNIIVKEKKIFCFSSIFFAFNRSKILSKSFGLLNEVADALKKNQKLNVRIEGHTDSKGRDRYNKKLSEARAKSVRNYLIKQGVGAERMIAVGFGEERPIADNGTAEGREMNRRVEFVIITAE